MKVGFIILNYNTWELTRDLAIKIASYKCIDYTIVVDNCSTDDSLMHLRKLDTISGIIVTKTDHNGGYSYGNNIGMQKCREQGIDIAFIANPDVLVSEEVLVEIVDAIIKTDYSLISTLQYEIDGSIAKPIILKRNTYKDDLIDCFFLLRKIAGKKGERLKTDQKIQQVDMFRGAFFGVAVNAFFDVGGFDDNVFLFCEERTLSKRLEQKGYKIGILTNGRYDHMHSVTINKTYKTNYKKTELLFKSRLYYNQTYNSVSQLGMSILKLSMNMSLIERRVLGKLHIIR